MRILIFFLIIQCATFSACSAPQTAAPNEQITNKTWQIQTAQSSINFISIKKNNIAEIHNMTALNGSVTADGVAKFSIDLNSVQTNIDIRNERIRTYLFETQTYKNADITAQIDMDSFANMSIGARTVYPLKFNLNLHGAVRSLDTEVMVTRLSVDKIAVESREPILLGVDDFGLMDGLAKLAELANLPPITPVVPVTFSVVLERL